MALTRKFLTALGIEAEKIDEIITAHSETVNALKAERDEYKDKLDNIGDVQKELDEAKKSAETNSKLKEDYDKLKQEYDSYKSDVETKATKKAKEDAYTKLLTEAGIPEKRVASILKVTNLDKFELDKDGNAKDVDKHKESIKTEWADFIVQKKTEGASVSHPPKGTGDEGKPLVSRAAQIANQFHTQMYGAVKGE